MLLSTHNQPINSQKIPAYTSSGCVKINLSEGVSAILPDFTIKFLGEFEQPLINGRRILAPAHQYEISQGEEKKVVKWSTGAGGYGPALFTFQNAHYSLEKRVITFTEEFNSQLTKDDVVICKVNLEMWTEKGMDPTKINFQ